VSLAVTPAPVDALPGALVVPDVGEVWQPTSEKTPTTMVRAAVTFMEPSNIVLIV